MDRITGQNDGAYHRWGGHKPGMPTFGYRSPHAALVGQTVTLKAPLTAEDGTRHEAGTRARVVQATPRGLVLKVGREALLRGVGVAEVGEGSER